MATIKLAPDQLPEDRTPSEQLQQFCHEHHIEMFSSDETIGADQLKIILVTRRQMEVIERAFSGGEYLLMELGEEEDTLITV